MSSPMLQQFRSALVSVRFSVGESTRYGSLRMMSAIAMSQQLSARGNVVKTNLVSVADALYPGATLENTL